MKSLAGAAFNSIIFQTHFQSLLFCLLALSFLLINKVRSRNSLEHSLHGLAQLTLFLYKSSLSVSFHFGSLKGDFQPVW